MQAPVKVFALLFFLVNVVYADELENIKKQIFTKCRTDAKLPENGFQGFYDFESIDPIKDHKCVVNCIFDNYKIFTPDGTIDETKLIEVLKRFWKTPENERKYTPVVKSCLAKVPKVPDPCEYTYNALSCYIDGKHKA